MKKCNGCNSPLSTMVVKYMDRLAMQHHVAPNTYYCLDCQVLHGLSTFDSKYPVPSSKVKANQSSSKPSTSKISFDLEDGEKIVNVKRLVGVENSTQLNKHIVYAYLTAMNHLNVIPKGYLSRVNNKNTSFISASKYVQSKLEQGFDYKIIAKEVEDSIMLALVKKA